MKTISPNQLRNEMHILMEKTSKEPVHIRGLPGTGCVMMSFQRYHELIMDQAILKQMRKELDGT